MKKIVLVKEDSLGKEYFEATRFQYEWFSDAEKAEWEAKARAVLAGEIDDPRVIVNWHPSEIQRES